MLLLLIKLFENFKNHKVSASILTTGKGVKYIVYHNSLLPSAVTLHYGMHLGNRSKICRGLNLVSASTPMHCINMSIMFLKLYHNTD